MKFSKFAVLYGPFCVFWSKMNLEHLSSSNGLVCSKKKFLKSSLEVFSEATLDLIFKNIPKSPEIQNFRNFRLLKSIHSVFLIQRPIFSLGTFLVTWKIRLHLCISMSHFHDSNGMSHTLENMLPWKELYHKG